MNNVNKKNNCCGCGACLNLCPKKAISINCDEYGNKYPIIDREKCIKCNLCKKICLFSNYNKERENLDCYAGYSKNNELHSKSSSGGIFGSIAAEFLKNGGYVCGCSLDYINDTFSIEHIIINDIKELYKLQGSKYVQSNIINVLPRIKELLDDGSKVLFSGTPCQIVGLKSFLRKDYENLFTIDIVCHGAPDKKLFLDYVSFVEQNKKVKITDIKFRDKTKGWTLYGYGYMKGHYIDNPSKKFNMIFNNTECSYYYLFQKGYLYRPNCYKCPYASKNRPGDLTIGDYWGIEKEHPEINNKKGISCVITNSNKGSILLNNYGKNLELIDSSFEKIQRNNDQLQHPTNEPKLNKLIMEEYSKYGYNAVEKNFIHIYGKINLYKSKIKTRLKLILKK